MFNFLEATSNASNGLGGMTSIIMIVAMLGVMYFLMIRPENKRKKEAEKMRSSVKTGDKITTIGGIVGQVVSVKGDTITIATGKDRVKIRFLKTAVREVTVKANAEAEEPASNAAIEPAKEKTEDKKVEEPAAGEEPKA